MAQGPQPTLAGYTAWLYNVVGIPSAWLPSDSETIPWSYYTAVATVNRGIQGVPGPIYLQAVYNLATHLLFLWAVDPTTSPPQPYKTVDGEQYGYFQWFRKQNNMLGFVTGTVSSSGDEGTSVGLVVPRQAENLTVGQLQLTTSPWGRAYLGIAQSYGTNWGIS